MVNYLGETIVIRATIRDENNNLIDPTTTKCYIIDSTGKEQSSGDMTKISQGIYEYEWNSEEANLAGQHKAKIVATYQSRITYGRYNFDMSL